ncbi:hypothetical protein F0P96_18590 [Hymenobacter busanensis]|uniref:Integron cassette protein VCH-CASS1 chain domain-containing protein n=1 Tax=Hymenobacter busanensis TaxID=2607656 RepID=A0A7L4ZS88_9BACT|nr:hypothetical protein [Hymenobacter busanensis]KAA9327242.1 hypothetical protein F0P96_18590 [Hymenobacter busanensis]QHJ05908.1 hypothetical protein GUY19_00795 [Hymenobacter busanensis]
MALTVTEVEELRNYLIGVMERADHHAGNVHEIALALMGAMIWRKDEDQDIRVMTRDGQAKNVLWVVINSQRYALVYNHSTGAIDMREDGIQGNTLKSFTNATPLSDVRQFFASL